MATLKVVVFSFMICLCSSSNLEFPASFKFGVSTSSYQVEGAWNVSDKGENTWDHFTHTNSSVITDGSNGDVACDSYHLWRRDIEMASELGLNTYRFSISWSRLLPDGYTNRISEDGKKYYNNLIDGLLEKGIEPIVTMHHFDLPQTIQNIGGWTNPLIVDFFAEYARVVYSLYADRVKTWVTLNEPLMMCDYSYGSGALAPGITEPKIAVYICNKNILIAHAKAWRIYDEEYKPLYHGKVSVSNHLIWFQPYSPEDEQLTKLVRQFFARYTHPIYSEEGGWPQAIEEIMREVSVKEGYAWSRLPSLSKDEIQLIKGTYDYFAMNHYTSLLVRSAEPGEEIVPSIVTGIEELGAVLEPDPSWPIGASMLAIYPEGLRKQMAWLKQQYGDIEIIITENGYATNASTSSFYDENRINYINSYLEQALLSIVEDGVKLTGYNCWSLMDNFELSSGYTSKYGLYDVDFSSPLRTRTPRASAFYYKSIIQSRSLPHQN